MHRFKKILSREGDRLKLADSGAPAYLFIVEQFGFSHFTNGEIFKFIDAVADNGGNGIRVFGFYPFGKGREEEPHVRSGSGYDLNRFNPAYFDYLKKWVEHAQKRRILVLYELFDSVGLKVPAFSKYHPFGKFVKDDLRAFTDLKDSKLISLQKQYVHEVVGVLKRYPNVIFGIINEFLEIWDKHWHFEISKQVKELAPEHLIAASEENSPAKDDPHVDIWFIHTGSYDFNRCRSHVAKDIAEIRPHIGNKILGYSTDGFGTRGRSCENPQAMTNLARDVKDNRLQILSFLDHRPYVDVDDSGKERPFGEASRNDDVFVISKADRLNTETYRAISKTFPAPLLPTEQEPPPEGFIRIFNASLLVYTHPGVYLVPVNGGIGRAITATTAQGFLCITPRVKSPPKPLEAYFSLFIDNNDFDDAVIVILDVYDAYQDKILANLAVTRKQFPKAQAFNLFKLPFIPVQDSNLELRVYYFGFAYVVVDKLAIVDPSLIQLNNPSEIPNIHYTGLR